MVEWGRRRRIDEACCCCCFYCLCRRRCSTTRRGPRAPLSVAVREPLAVNDESVEARCLWQSRSPSDDATFSHGRPFSSSRPFKDFSFRRRRPASHLWRIGSALSASHGGFEPIEARPLRFDDTAQLDDQGPRKRSGNRRGRCRIESGRRIRASLRRLLVDERRLSRRFAAATTAAATDEGGSPAQKTEQDAAA
jgi:hypothetical protein